MEADRKDGCARTHELWVLVFAGFMVIGALALCAAVSEDAEAQENKQITLYLHNVTPSKQIGNIATLRTMDTLQGAGPVSMTEPPTINSVKENWYLYPSLANDTTIEGEVTMYMWAIRTVRMGDSDQVTLIYDLFDVDASGAKVAKIARGLRTLGMVLDWRQYSVTNDSVGTYTVKKGHYLLVEFELQGSSSNWYQLAWGDNNYRSAMVIETRDYLVVRDAEVRDSGGTPTDVLFLDAPDKDVTLWTEVADPFGGYDIRYVNATLVGPDGRTILDDLPMVKTSGYFTSYLSTFELGWNYAGSPEGLYTLSIAAVDHSGYYHRFPHHPDDLTYGGHLEVINITFWIGGLPQAVTVTVRDNSTMPIHGAEVLIEGRQELSDPIGEALLWIANGTFGLSVYWQDILVYEGTVTVSGPTGIFVEARVYNPSFIVFDDLGDPVEDAVAIITHPNGTVLSSLGRTDDTGAFSLSQMAWGDYGISILWRGMPVYEGTLTIQSNGPFELGAWIYTLGIEVVDDLGAIVGLAQVIVYNSSSHMVLDSRVTGPDGMTSSRLPLGSYDLEVFWRNTLVHDATTDHLVNASGDITLVATIYTLNITVVDSADLPLVGAKVLVAYGDGSIVLDFLATEGSATISTRVAPTSYSIRVYWHDVLVNHTWDIEVTGHDELVVVCDVHWVPVRVEDSKGVALASASVSMVHVSDQSFGSMTTGPTGEATFHLPAGDYEATVLWMDALVVHEAVTVLSNETLVLRVAVHYLDVLVVDGSGLALEGAMVIARGNLTGTLIRAELTDGDGAVTLRLPVGDALLSVSWMDAPVHEGVYTVEGDGDLTLTATVFWPTFKAVDSRDLPIESAQVLVTSLATGISFGGHMTGPEGEVTLRLPLGTYEVRSFWKDHLVFDGVQVVEGTSLLVLECTVHYVDLHVVDADGLPLENAQIIVKGMQGSSSMGDIVTGDDGIAYLRLPIGTFSASVSWRGIAVLEAAFGVTSDGTQHFVAMVFYAKLRILDSRAVGLMNAEVSLALAGIGTTFGLSPTDVAGEVTFRVPIGDYQVTVRWMDTLVLARGLRVEESATHVLDARVYYLTFHTVDSSGLDLPDGTLTVSNGTTGAVLGSGATDATGSIELRLPQGSVGLLLSWMSVEVNDTTGIPVDGDGNVTVAARVHHLTVRVRDADGIPLRRVGVSVDRQGTTVASGLTDGKGLAALRLPEGLYGVRITYRTTDRMTPVDIAKSREVELLGATTVTFDLSDDDYPLPFGRTNLFYVVLTVIVLLVVTALLTRRFLAPKADVPSSPTSPNEDDDLQLELEDEGSRDLLRDLVDESEIELENEEL